MKDLRLATRHDLLAVISDLAAPGCMKAVDLKRKDSEGLPRLLLDAISGLEWWVYGQMRE